MTDVNQNPKQKRNKIILIVVVIVVVCLVACGVAYFALRNAVTNAVQLDPAKIKSYASQITDYDLPVGYKEEGGTSTFGVISVIISDASRQNMIYLIQAPNNSTDPDNFLRTVVAYQKNNPITWTSIDAKVYAIRGTKSPITIYDGIAQNGQKYRAWIGKFTGRGGQAFIIIVGPSATWKDSVAEAFLDSMK